MLYKTIHGHDNGSLNLFMPNCLSDYVTIVVYSGLGKLAGTGLSWPVKKNLFFLVMPVPSYYQDTFQSQRTFCGGM